MRKGLFLWEQGVRKLAAPTTQVLFSAYVVANEFVGLAQAPLPRARHLWPGSATLPPRPGPRRGWTSQTRTPPRRRRAAGALRQRTPQTLPCTYAGLMRPASVAMPSIASSRRSATSRTSPASPSCSNASALGSRRSFRPPPETPAPAPTARTALPAASHAPPGISKY
jgi:hypothetical protein